MQANMLSTEYDEISDMHKKVLRVSDRFTQQRKADSSTWLCFSKVLICGQYSYSSF